MFRRAVAAGALLLVAGCATDPATSTSASQTTTADTGSASVPATTTPRGTPSTTVPTTAPSSRDSSSPAAFAAEVFPIYEGRRQRMIESGSWNGTCSVPFADLRLVRVSYWGFDQTPHTGELVLNEDAVDAVVSALGALYEARFPIRKMVTVEDYGADDEMSMRDDNSSAFNGRFVEGTTSCSQHAYGRAIDINPVENPMVKDGKVYPATAGDFVDRDQEATGMIHAGDVVVRAFAGVGWSWGGDWHSLKDWQHFSANGR